jgi:hypothetical protein
VNLGDPTLMDSGLVGREKSAVLSNESNIDGFSWVDCGELGTVDGAIERCVWDDCIDHRGKDEA